MYCQHCAETIWPGEPSVGINPKRARVRLHFGLKKKETMFIHTACYPEWEKDVWNRINHLVRGK